MPSPEFKKRLNRTIRLVIQETMDGCCDCRVVKGLCHKHYKEVLGWVNNPRGNKELQELLKSPQSSRKGGQQCS